MIGVFQPSEHHHFWTVSLFFLALPLFVFFFLIFLSHFLCSFVRPWSYSGLGCTGTAFLAEYQHRVRQGYGYAYHMGTKVPNAYQRAKLKFQKYGYVWVPYGYVFWVKHYKNPPKNNYLPYFPFNLSSHPPIRRRSYRTSNQKGKKPTQERRNSES